MSQRLFAAAVVVVAVLVATSVPVQAAVADDVASVNTTATDFQNATTLQNVSVSGSGTSASVTYSDVTTVDDAEDGDVSEYDGETASISAESGTLMEGDYYLNLTHSGSGWEQMHSTSGLPEYPSAGGKFTLDFILKKTSSYTYFEFGFQDTDNFYFIEVDPGNGEARLAKVDGGSFTTFDTISVNWATDSTYTAKVSWGGSGTLDVTITNSTGTVASLSGTDTTFKSGGIGYRLGSSGTQTYVDDWQLEDDIASGTYIGQAHDADKVEKGFVDLSLDGADATVTWQKYDGSSWVDQTSTTYTTSGNKTLSWNLQGVDKWRVKVEFSDTSTWASSASIDDEGVLFNASAPTVDNSSMEPRNNQKISTQNPTLKIDVNDSDFATSQSDSLTVEFYVDNSKVGSDSLNSNGTAEYTVSQDLSGGSHDWYAVVTDSYGEQVTSKTQSFQAPGTLYIRNVSNVTELVDSPVTVELKFFVGNETIIERSTTTGKVNMSGLPVSGPIVVTAEPSNDYAKRTVIITSLYDQQSVFLLNTSTTTAANVTFGLDDKTGKFPADDTYIEVQAPVNRSKYSGGGTGLQWTTISGDYFDASGEFDATLEDEKRYRIVIRNSQNQSRVLGQYVAEDGEFVPLPIGRVSFDTQGNKSYGARVELVEVNNQDYLKIVYRDLDEDTSEVTYNVSYRSNSTVLFSNRTVNGPLGTTTELIAVSNTTTNYEVTFWIDRNGATVKLTRYAGQVPEVYQNWGLDSKWGELIGWVSIIALTGLAVIVNPRLASIIAVASATLLTWIGLVSLPGLALTLAGATAIILAVGGGSR